MGLAVHIIAVGLVVALVLLVVPMHAVDAFLVCLNLILLYCERCVTPKDCSIDSCQKYAVWFLLFGMWCDLLELAVLKVADELFPVIIIMVQTSMMVARGFATPSARIVFAIFVRLVAG